MNVKYILTVCDYEVCGFFMKTVRTYRSSSLSAIRHKATKLANKARKTPSHREITGLWGREVHNGPSFHPIRTLTITAKVA